MCNYVLRNGRNCRRRGRNNALSQLGYCTYHYNRNEREQYQVFLANDVNNNHQNNNRRRRRRRRRDNILNEDIRDDIIEEIPEVHNHTEEEKCDSCYGKIMKECSICLSGIECSKNHYITECIHHFHEECFQKWYRRNKTCPLCRQTHIGYDRPIYNKLTDRQYTNLENTILNLNMEDILSLLQNNNIRRKLFMD